MATQDHIVRAEQEFEKAIAHFRSELSRLQVGRASASLVEDLKVEAYGSFQSLKSLASIGVPDPKTIQIQPWDRGLLAAVERAIHEAKLGLNPINDGKLIRVPMPPLNEERRRDLAKVLHQMAENAKIAVRTSRGSAHGAFKTMEDSDEITEDDRRLAEKHLQEKVDKANKEIEEFAKKKEADIMTL